MNARHAVAALVAALTALALPMPGAAQSQADDFLGSVGCYIAWDSVPEVNVGSQFGYTDSAIRAALGVAKRDSCRVWFQPGTYVYDTALPIEGLKVWGAGDSSVLSATTKSSMALVLSGVAPELHGVKITCTSCELPAGPPTLSRLSTPYAAGVYLKAGTSGFVVENVTVERAGQAGIFVHGAHDGRLTGNRVRDTLADAYHITNGAYNIDVAFNRAENSGDDFYAVVSYGGNPSPSHDISIHDNVGIRQPWGRGIYLSGYRLKALRNDIRQTHGAAILMESGGYWNTHGAQDVQIAGNVVRLADQANIHDANILLVAGSDDPDHRMSNVFGSGNDLDCSMGHLLRVVGSNVSGVTVSGFCGS